uniref:Uncharacterized protein n=1 Tax=Meloidogyne enterolobii TaxID=390850 RepID=A0A6V7UF86_MELEN|nr:unnamed protein product [Meloidogyne enterolobii]
MIKRARRAVQAPLANPISLDQLVIPQEYQIYVRSEGREEQFLLDDSGVYEENGHQHRILIFGRDSYGGWAHEMQECFMDGTFSISPNLFQQVYVKRKLGLSSIICTSLNKKPCNL